MLGCVSCRNVDPDLVRRWELSVDVAAKSFGRKPGPDNLEAVTLACYEDGKRITALELL